MSAGSTSLISKTQYLLLAEGGIDPIRRVDAGEITNEQITEFSERVGTDEFDVTIRETMIPCMCVDGRLGSCAPGPNAAAGTFSLVVGDALTDGNYLHDGENASDHANRIFQHLRSKYRIGGHDDTHCVGDKSGCGAQDKLGSILDYLTRRGDEVRQLLANLNVEIDDELHHLIINRSVQRLREGYVTNGSQLKQAFVDQTGPQSVDTVFGEHGEVVLRINTQPGNTLNRHKLKNVFGDKLQAFNLDLAGLIEGAKATAISSKDAHRKMVGALYYNVATAAVLAGSSLIVVVR